MDVLKVVQQLRDLAVDPQNRATIVRVRWSVHKTTCMTSSGKLIPYMLLLYMWQESLLHKSVARIRNRLAL